VPTASGSLCGCSARSVLPPRPLLCDRPAPLNKATRMPCRPRAGWLLDAALRGPDLLQRGYLPWAPSVVRLGVGRDAPDEPATATRLLAPVPHGKLRTSPLPAVSARLDTPHLPANPDPRCRAGNAGCALPALRDRRIRQTRGADSQLAGQRRRGMKDDQTT
jgi:hypothetical protein